jgi:hypothetical protein
VRDLFALNEFESTELTVAEEELTKIRNNRRLKIEDSSTDIASFWLSLQQEYPIITKKVTEACCPFSTLYLCEAGSSDMNTMKSKNR